MAHGARRRAVVVLFTLVAGCAADGGGSATATSTSNPLASARSLTPAACVLVRQNDASALFGLTARQVEVENKPRASSVCAFAADSKADVSAIDDVSYSLLVYVFDGTDHFTRAATQDTTPIAGLGDGAFQVVRGDLATVAFTASGQSIEIDLSVTGLAAHPAAASYGARLVALARAAAARM